MINASKEKLLNFYSGNIRYHVPFFQRSYVWDIENWEILWDNVYQVFTDYRSQKPSSEHFIGTLITKQRAAERIGENSYDIIDGQQRLTTIALFLKAIADTCKGTLPKLQEKTNDLLLFEDSKGNQYIRIEHSQYDKEYFEAILTNKTDFKPANKDHRILRAYDFFLKKIEPLNDDDRDDLKSIILDKVPIISMMLAVDDDEQVIFDTINSLGVRLTTAELLKNFIFKDKNLQPFYTTHWNAIFESEEEQITFWNKPKTAGRVIRTNVEVLLYCYLIIKTQTEVRLEKLFKDYKGWLAKKTLEERIAFLVELKQFAEIYAAFPDGEELNEIAYSETEKKFFHVMQNLEITTAYPLILFIYKEVPTDAERMLMLRTLESYLMRRNICRLTTKNYNNLFLSIIQKLIAKKSTESKTINNMTLCEILNAFDEDTNLFPADADMKLSFTDSAISNNHAREVLYGIALFQKDSNLSDVKKLSSSSFSVEHFLPVKWEANWNEPVLTEAAKFNRNRKLKTIGNLTLVTQRLNSKMQNSAWPQKKTLLKQYSSLAITTDYVELPTWDESTIANRATKLYELSLNIWPK